MTTAELQRHIEARTAWRPIDPCECAVCGQKPEQEPDNDQWLEELALLGEWWLV